MAKYFNDTMDRSWVDLFTNEAFVFNNKTFSLSDIVFSQKFPKEILFSFLHEATHHWCFDSLLGNALFAMKVRAFSASLHFKTAYPTHQDANSGIIIEGTDHINQKYDIYSDFARFESVALVLKPLAEGMALFSEFDTFPCQSEICPSFLTYTSIVFSGIERGEFAGKEKFGFEESYFKVLIERRFSSEEGIIKKSRLFCTSTNAIENPYLTGYLFIKTLQLALIDRNQKFANSTYFLQFVKDFFYEDPAFIEVILDRQTKDEEIVPIIFDYFQHRINQLLLVNDDIITEFESNHTKAYKNKSLLNLSSSINFSQLPGLSALIDNFNLSLKQHELTSLAFLRIFFKATSLPCYIEVDNKAVTIFFKISLQEVEQQTVLDMLKVEGTFKDDYFLYHSAISFSNSDGCKAYKGDAVMEKYVSFRDPTRHFSIFSFAKNCVFTPFSDSHLTEEEILLIKDYMKSGRVKLKDIDFDHIIQNVWDDDDSLITTIEAFHSSNNFDKLDKIYRQRAFYCSNDAYTSIDSLVGQNGFYDLFGSTRLIKLLSFLSLISSNKCAEVSQLAQNEIFSSFSADEVRELYAIQKKAGFYILSMDKQNICTYGV